MQKHEKWIDRYMWRERERMRRWREGGRRESDVLVCKKKGAGFAKVVWELFKRVVMTPDYLLIKPQLKQEYEREEEEIGDTQRRYHHLFPTPSPSFPRMESDVSREERKGQSIPEHQLFPLLLFLSGWRVHIFLLFFDKGESGE